jgi:hypothetical protein
MKISGIPSTIHNLQTEIARCFDVEVVTVHPHEPDSRQDIDIDRFMICCEFANGCVYMKDCSAVQCLSRRYVTRWIAKMRKDLGIHP